MFKIAFGKSNDEMQSVFSTLLETGVLPLRKVQHQNTLSRWMNDERLTPILEKILELTARVFRAVECAGIVDSSKMSQMRSAHSRWVEYGDDQRDGADWMKMHALVGVETLVCMAVMFSGSDGKGTHDVNFILPLVERVRGIFALRYVLADKAYLSENVVGRLWQMGMQAVIPIKKGWDGKTMKQFYEPYQRLVRWYDDRQPDFHMVYRLRPKIEGYFSLVKRVSSGFCWSRGRPRKGADGKLHYGGNADGPCTAWQNETLCKLIYVNLRLIVQYEIATGYRMNFLTDTFFPSIPEDDKLIA
ncbi:MAG TPA: transposase [Candidatus Elarobacter sp.]|nr:transposase [Candidatus Elarobacter sp.]